MGMPLGATSISGANPPITKTTPESAASKLSLTLALSTFCCLDANFFVGKLTKTESEQANTRH